MDNNKWQYQNQNYKQSGNPNWRGGKEVPCAHCGKLVYRTPSGINKHKNTFCSKLCHDDFRRKPEDPNRLRAEDMQGYKHPSWNGIVKYCKFCNKELIGVKDRKRGYCSDSCVIANRKNNKGIRRGENHHDWKGGKVTLKCWQCGNEFTVRRDKENDAHYCSYECMHVGRRNRVTIQCLQCDKEFIVSAIRFRDLNPRFCSISCSRSYQGKTTLESKVLIAIEQLELKYIDEYRPKGTRRIFDFYLLDLNTLVEADGDFWHYSEWAENKGMSKRDKAKTKWAIDNGYKLIRLRESDVEKFGALALLQRELA